MVSDVNYVNTKPDLAMALISTKHNSGDHDYLFCIWV